MASANPNRPLGVPIAEPSPAPRPSRIGLKGRTVTLEPLSASHAEALFPHVGGEENGWLWDYMPTGALADVEQLRSLLAGYEKSEDPIFWAVTVNKKAAHTTTMTTTTTTADHTAVVGYISFLNIVPGNRTIEVGHVMYSPALQRTTPATEAVYLLLRYAFRDLGYRRVEWKCNDLNAGSRNAALRFGFTFEGVFRQHMIVRGRNRDTAWFSLLDSEWKEDGVEEGFDDWLHPTNFDGTGRQRKLLESCIQRRKMMRP